MTLNLKPKVIEEKIFQAKGPASAKTLMQGCVWHFQGTAGTLVWLKENELLENVIMRSQR